MKNERASGLICSLCSNAVNKALKTLDFVLQVDADIKTYTFQISFKPHSVIDFDMLERALKVLALKRILLWFHLRKPIISPFN